MPYIMDHESHLYYRHGSRNLRTLAILFRGRGSLSRTKIPSVMPCSDLFTWLGWEESIQTPFLSRAGGNRHSVDCTRSCSILFGPGLREFYSSPWSSLGLRWRLVL